MGGKSKKAPPGRRPSVLASALDDADSAIGGNSPLDERMSQYSARSGMTSYDTISVSTSNPGYAVRPRGKAVSFKPKDRRAPTNARMQARQYDGQHNAPTGANQTQQTAAATTGGPYGGPKSSLGVSHNQNRASGSSDQPWNYSSVQLHDANQNNANSPLSKRGSSVGRSTVQFDKHSDTGKSPRQNVMPRYKLTGDHVQPANSTLRGIGTKFAAREHRAGEDPQLSRWLHAGHNLSYEDYGIELSLFRCINS